MGTKNLVRLYVGFCNTEKIRQDFFTDFKPKDIFMLLKSNDNLKYFQDFLNSCHIKLSFSMKTEKENKLFFLDIEIIHKQDKFTTTVYQKPTLSGVYSNVASFLPSVYKFGMVYALIYDVFIFAQIGHNSILNKLF